jgi:hypothetical protein
LPKHKSMKAYSEIEVKLNAIVVWALVGSDCLASRCGSFIF